MPVLKPIHATLGALIITIAAASAVLGAGRPRTQWDADAVFRCQLFSMNCGSEAGPDRIRSDDLGMYVEFDPSTSEGASLNANREFYLNFIPGNTVQAGRFLSLDFSNQTAGAPSNRSFLQLNMDNGYMRTNTLTTDASTETANGLFDVPCGGSRPSRLLVTFKDPVNPSTREWVLWFNQATYADSDNVQVTRDGPTTWTISNDAANHGVLVSRTTLKNKLTVINEGTYAMPFAVTVTVPDAPSCP